LQGNPHGHKEKLLKNPEGIQHPEDNKDLQIQPVSYGRIVC